MKNTVQKGLALTAALLIVGCAASKTSNNETQQKKADNSDSDMGQCSGVNACKSSASCAVLGQNSCAGQNTCKGKGWLPLSQKDCQTRGGRFTGFKKQG